MSRETGLRRHRLILAAILLALVLAPSGGVATDRWDSVRALIRQTMTGAKLPSISVAVAHGGKIIWEESFGWADREKMTAATPQTMYSLASVSKPITATGMMTLVERGQPYLQRRGECADLTERALRDGQPRHWEPARDRRQRERFRSDQRKLRPAPSSGVLYWRALNTTVLLTGVMPECSLTVCNACPSRTVLYWADGLAEVL